MPAKSKRTEDPPSCADQVSQLDPGDPQAGGEARKEEAGVADRARGG